MSHDIMQHDTAVYTLKPAWHGLGIVLDYVPTMAQLREASGITWEPREAAIMDAETGRPIATHKMIKHGTLGHQLGIVGEGYGIVPNATLFQVAEDMGLRGETAFSMENGQSVVITARDEGTDTIAEGDTVSHYLLVTTSHDGTGAVVIKPTTVRVVCANTLRVAMGAKGDGLSIRHTRTAEARVKSATDALTKAREGYRNMVDTFRTMASRHIKPSSARDFLYALLPDDAKESDRVRKTRDATRATIAQLFVQDPKNNMPSIAGTPWSLLNAVTQHVDHGATRYVRGSTDREQAESRFRMRWDGSGNTLKSRAYDLLTSGGSQLVYQDEGPIIPDGLGPESPGSILAGVLAKVGR